MTHELVIHCFGEWWKATIIDKDFSLVMHNLEVLISPAVTFQARTVYDKTTKKFLKNAKNTSPSQVEMEIWMLGELQELNLERRAFERRRKSYYRLDKTRNAINNLLDRKK